MGIVINYRKEKTIKQTININGNIKEEDFLNSENLNTGVIGCGNYFSRVIVPILKNSDFKLNTLVTQSPLRASFYGKKFDFKNISTDVDSIINNSNIDIVFIGTRHNSHGELVRRCLDAGKHVFVEKPLCLNMEDLELIRKSHDFKNTLMVGFNRRFAPIYKLFKDKVGKYNLPKSIIYTCNAGNIPKTHWIHDFDEGGGRLIGEACHFLDLVRDLVDHPIQDLSLSKSTSNYLFDTFTINAIFQDGS